MLKNDVIVILSEKKLAYNPVAFEVGSSIFH
jgi:hypothetical protein